MESANDLVQNGNRPPIDQLPFSNFDFAPGPSKSKMSFLDTPKVETPGGTPLSAFTLSTPPSVQDAGTSPSPFPSTSRRQGASSHILSMYSTQDRVILDIGARFIRAGFSGEAFPRCCVDAATKTTGQVFWENEGWDPGLIEDRLERGLREVYSQYLLIESKARRVIVAEDTLLPYRIKEAICRVLFTYFQAPSVTFLSSHVLALASTGLRTAVVVDIGWHDTRILPIYELRPLNPFIQTSPIACKALHSRLEYLLTNYTIPQISSLSFSTIEDFLVRALYMLPDSPTNSSLFDGLIPNEKLHETYSPISSNTLEWFVPSAKQTVRVPHWICSSSSEIFFEGDRTGMHPDTNELGLATSLITCILCLPKDVRAKVMQAIVVVGGGASIPGLRTRLKNTVESLWSTRIRKTKTSTTPEGSRPSSYDGKTLEVGDLQEKKESGAFRFIKANALEATFLGGSLLGDLKIKGLNEVSREAFNSSHGRGVGDWTFVGGDGYEEVEESKRGSRG